MYSQFKETAAWYKNKFGKMPVIVFDNVNYLAEKNPDILEVIQKGAKQAIDDRAFITVFVSSDGLAPTQLESSLHCCFREVFNSICRS